MLGFLFFIFTKRLIKQSIPGSSRLIRCVLSWNRAAGWRRREKKKKSNINLFWNCPLIFRFICSFPCCVKVNNSDACFWGGFYKVHENVCVCLREARLILKKSFKNSDNIPSPPCLLKNKSQKIIFSRVLKLFSVRTRLSCIRRTQCSGSSGHEVDVAPLPAVYVSGS